MGLVEWLGIETLGDGVARMPMSARTRNQANHYHGASLASLAEEAAKSAAPAALARVPGLCATALNLNYIRPSLEPWVVARAGLIWAGDAGYACRVQVCHEDGKCTAEGLIQFGVIPPGAGAGARAGITGAAAGEPPRDTGEEDEPGARYDRAAVGSYRHSLGLRSLLMITTLVEMVLPGQPCLGDEQGLVPLGLLAGLMDNGSGQCMLGNRPAHLTATINLQAHLLRRVEPQELLTRVEAVQKGRTIGVLSGMVFAGGVPAAAGMATFMMKQD